MDTSIRGIECTLEEDAIESLLRYFSEDDSSIVVPCCMINGEGIETQNADSVWSPAELCKLSQESILELVLQIYPPNSLPSKIETYADFVESECSICVIYYDCGMLEMYIKNLDDFNRIKSKLISLHVQDMIIKTALNDKRVKMCL